MADLATSAFPGFCDKDYEVFCQRVQKSFGLRLNDYKPDQMRRRIATLASQSKCESFLTDFAMLERDSTSLGAFLDHVTINVTELFRNPKIFETLPKHLNPMLQANKSSTLTVWSAGCSYGAEAYSLAILLTEMKLDRQIKIKGTDIDLSVLAKANSPSFSDADMVNVSPARRSAYFMTLDNISYMPSAKLRNLIQFSRHDLLADSYPAEQYDLIVCRNVLIYFTNEAKTRIFQGMLQALKPGGILFVGGTESITDHTKIGYELLEPFFYKRPQMAARVQLRAA
jgi:chemotaxis protein methyltransferase CheR